MEDNNQKIPESNQEPQVEKPIVALPAKMDADLQKEDRKRMVLVIAGAVVVLVAVVFAIIYLMQASTPTDKIRDVFIIFMALESLIIGVALVILIVQLATLINLLQNEIKPIINSTNETVNTLKGTATFISNNVAEPIIKLNEYLAALQKLFDFVKPRRR